MKKIIVKQTLLSLMIIIMLTTSIFPPLSARGQSQDESVYPEPVRGQILKTYRENHQAEPGKGKKEKESRPDWVQAAVQRALDKLSERKAAIGLRDVESELELLGVDEDDLGQTHVRMDQMHNGVEVFGGQLIAHLDDQSLLSVNGQVFEEAHIDTTPVLTFEQAIDAAKTALGHKGKFASEPTAKLVVLPHQIFKDGKEKAATLVYLVGLRTTDEEAGPAHHQYFVDARDGEIVWHYNGLASGTGHSLFSGTVSLSTTYIPNSRYALTDPSRGFTTRDMNDQNDVARAVGFLDNDDVWGNGTLNDRQTVAVDAYLGIGKAWNYFLYAHGRRGLDGNGRAITSYVHYRQNPSAALNNAFGSKDGLFFGDGDGTTFRPFVSLDVVGHEYTHALVDYAVTAPDGLGLTYANESGAIDESFADIFGTMMEWYYNINADYLIGEDFVLPAGNALRDMRMPTNFSQPAHYSKYVNTTSDNGGVHTNSGIMNNAFYLLAEGGRNSVSGIEVPRIGGWDAARIFYRALTTGLPYYARFSNVYEATRQAATDLYGGPGNFMEWAVTRAWQAVGVVPLYSRAIQPGYYVLRAKHSGKVLSVYNYSFANGGVVNQWDNAGYDNQKWLIEAIGDGYFKITAKHSGKVLSVNGYSFSTGGTVDQWDFGGGDNQKWLIAPAGNGEYTIFAKHSHKALSVYEYSYANGGAVNQWDFAGYDNQKWRLERVF